MRSNEKSETGQGERGEARKRVEQKLLKPGPTMKNSPEHVQAKKMSENGSAVKTWRARKSSRARMEKKWKKGEKRFAWGGLLVKEK